MKKLFGVTITNKIYVMAEDKKDAERVAKENIREEESSNFHVMPMEVGNSGVYVDQLGEWEIEEEWKNSIPYGGDDDKTCSEIVIEMKQKEENKKIKAEADKKQLKFKFYNDWRNGYGAKDRGEVWPKQ